ncbi:hypothetical protein A3H89_05590 [Candidatus Amesbacteria bacterium RIFCSPLOWO2_02_FULL_48_11]|uniref:Isoprenylcysteine carboxyl methyltransferase n=3 Tax=Candidatus Amesiibacteriota TaxID=1752730 RepID=A0A0G1XL48_9BACT|nr:MAG: hypothetical protein UX78_C0001G0006 [Candidatus Amesbacteria bacterium GW2011_GWA2_47_11]KKU95065.1 MAG: hypothetical protein UY22_C0001G0009 [Candidatus Amesbacteria bacterium GW2011_GWC1_48_10]OGC95136.1 MAG: hypothetical protein A3C34_00180 [Candidatus Amesbacteria bacterium RIFCSPHIGHO2_02_FULL_48_21]OGC96820.1 MAG: hypothetical protein A2W16_01490 [Candidatus Amesbacteria bacterium RBG_16_48_31]OGD06554.1 MAG: hypothetical protein A3H89_05590 [Candidatus Amesbacteria bacterium RIF
MRPASLVFGILVGSTIFMVIPLMLIKLNSRFSFPIFISPSSQTLGSIFILAGIAVVLACFGLFRFLGRGTPIPTDPPKQLVIKGLYKYSRNPMYIAYILLLLGEFLLLGHVLLLGYLLVFIPLCHLLVVCYEEPVLQKRFGQSYLDYCLTTPRWIKIKLQ